MYVAARAPDAGEDYTALAKKYPTPPASCRYRLLGRLWTTERRGIRRDFAGDLPAEKGTSSLAVQGPFKHDIGSRTKQRHAAWRSRPGAVITRYRLEDRTIIPDLEGQPFTAKRIPGAKTIEVKASHRSRLTSAARPQRAHPRRAPRARRRALSAHRQRRRPHFARYRRRNNALQNLWNTKNAPAAISAKPKPWLKVSASLR